MNFTVLLRSPRPSLADGVQTRGGCAGFHSVRSEPWPLPVPEQIQHQMPGTSLQVQPQTIPQYFLAIV